MNDEESEEEKRESGKIKQKDKFAKKSNGSIFVILLEKDISILSHSNPMAVAHSLLS